MELWPRLMATDLLQSAFLLWGHLVRAPGGRGGSQNDPSEPEHAFLGGHGLEPGPPKRRKNERTFWAVRRDVVLRRSGPAEERSSGKINKNKIEKQRQKIKNEKHQNRN